jgi:hypothetical protein
MNPNSTPTAFPSLFTFLVGAALGAVVVAFTTPKSGPRLRRDLKALARRSRDRARGAVEGFRGHGPRNRRTFVWHAPDPTGDHPVSVNDLPG